MEVLLLLFLCVLLAARVSQAESGFCGIGEYASSASEVGPYSKVIQPTLSPSDLEDLPGFTRSVVERDHALITPESHVFSALPEWTNTQGAHLITPALGSHFSMYMAKMGENSSSSLPLAGMERFVFVVAGLLGLSIESSATQLQVHFPAHQRFMSSEVEHRSMDLLIFRLISNISSSQQPRRLSSFSSAGDAYPELIVGDTEAQPVLETPGEVFILRKLLPSNHHYDFNVHIMDFQPGEFLNVKEVHYNQHGLLLLEGRGIYKLAAKWYPVQAGDVIWMAPFVPQWYAALGRTKSRYLLYKDVNREPLLHPYSS